MPAHAQIQGRPDCPTCKAQRNTDPDRLSPDEVPYPIAASYRDPVAAALRQAEKQASKDRQLAAV